jgi:hypothetical protein
VDGLQYIRLEWQDFEKTGGKAIWVSQWKQLMLL